MDVSLSTFIIVVVVFLFAIAILLVSKSKLKPNEVEEMKKTGWEIVTEIQQQLEKFQAEKQEMETLYQEMKTIEHRLTQKNSSTKPATKPQPPIIPTNVSEQKRRIAELYQEGYNSEEIAQQLHLQKGVVDVILNVGKISKRA